MIEDLILVIEGAAREYAQSFVERLKAIFLGNLNTHMLNYLLELDIDPSNQEEKNNSLTAIFLAAIYHAVD